MSYKVLGQAALTADVDADLYTVPASTQAVISSLVMCNRGSAPALFSILVRPSGGAIANIHYIYYDVELQGNSTFVFTGGITLDTTDVVTVRASESTVSANLFGKEVSV